MNMVVEEPLSLLLPPARGWGPSLDEDRRTLGGLECALCRLQDRDRTRHWRELHSVPDPYRGTLSAIEWTETLSLPENEGTRPRHTMFPNFYGLFAKGKLGAWQSRRSSTISIPNQPWGFRKFGYCLLHTCATTEMSRSPI